MKKLIVAGVLALGAPLALAQVQGVSKNEIVLGTSQDMSGPAVPFSKPAVNGMKMRIDEINDSRTASETSRRISPSRSLRTSPQTRRRSSSGRPSRM